MGDHTVARVLEEEVVPLKLSRLFEPYHEIEDDRERRWAVMALHLDGWSVKTTASYLKISNKTVYRAIGSPELLAALGPILPTATGVAAWPTTTHLRHHERQMLPVNAGLLDEPGDSCSSTRLGSYLTRFVTMTGSTAERVVVVSGYAGRGAYPDGTLGW